MKILRNLLGLVLLGLCSGWLSAQSTVAGVILPFANGRVSATVGTITNNASIDNQGNFSITVPSNSSPNMGFTPASGSPYAPFTVTIFAGPGTTNITQTIAPFVSPTIGVYIGLNNQSSVGTNAAGYSIPGSAGPGTITGVTASAPIVATPSGTTVNITCPSCGTSLATVQSVAVGNLAPLFTTVVSNPTTTASAAYTLSNAAQNSVFAGPATGGDGVPSYQTAPMISAANMTSFPTLNQPTTSTAANLSGTPALPNGTTATTQTVGDNTTKLATTAFVLANSSGSGNTTSTSLTPNTIPKASGANSVINSGLTDDGTKLTYTGSGTVNSIGFPASSTPITPVASTAIYGSDASGNTVVSENGVAASRICTAANGICAQTFPSAGIMVSTGGAFGTSLTAPTGTIVGTSDTQTLTNKSIAANQLTGTLQAGQFPALTGDVTTTAGALATTIAANAVTGAKMANNTVTATQLAAQYSKGSCTEAWGGSGTSFALTSGDDAISNNTCYNDSVVTRTITAVKCRASGASNTTTVNPTFGSAGTGTTILSAALTCGSSLAYSSTGTVTNASWTTGTGITPAMGGTLTGVSIAMIVEYTY